MASLKKTKFVHWLWSLFAGPTYPHQLTLPHPHGSYLLIVPSTFNASSCHRAFAHASSMKKTPLFSFLSIYLPVILQSSAQKHLSASVPSIIHHQLVILPSYVSSSDGLRNAFLLDWKLYEGSSYIQFPRGPLYINSSQIICS